MIAEGFKNAQPRACPGKSEFVWFDVRKDGEPDGHDVGFCFRNLTEMVLCGTRGKDARMAP